MDMERYSRQWRFAPIGQAGQTKLSQGRVAVVGMGALGSHLANTLVRAGVGYLRLIDRDYVEISNLQRQLLYDEADVAQGLPKAEAARRKLAAINSEVTVEIAVADLNWTNIAGLLQGVDLVLDGSDNFEVRYLINDYCLEHQLPWIYGGVVGSHGLGLVVLPGGGPCLRCLFPDPPAPGSVHTCDTTGVIAPAVQMVTAWQTAEAMKFLSGDKEKLAGGLFSFDVWKNRFDLLDVSQARRADCPGCGLGERPFLQGQDEMRFELLCGSNSVQVSPPPRPGSFDFAGAAQRLEALGEVSANAFLLKFTAADGEMVLFRDGRAIIKGTQDIAAAKSLYTQYIGM